MIGLLGISAAIVSLLASAPGAGRPVADKPFKGLPLRFEPTGEPGFAFEMAGGDFKALFGPALIELRLYDYSGAPTTIERRGQRRPERRYHPHTPPPRSEAVVRMQMVGGNIAANISGEAALPGLSNYYRGADPKKWRVGVPHYQRLRYAQVYPGIDLVVYGTPERRLEYDFVVGPGEDPSKIELALSGVETLQISGSGDLAWNTASGRVQQHRPVIFQDIDGRRVTVDGGYVLRGPDRVGFEITGAYDRRRPLIIDPTVSYSSFLGGTLLDIGRAVGVDSAGNAYVAGTSSPSVQDPSDIWVAKVNAAGTASLFWTVIGGTANEFVADAAIRPDGRTYVTGTTQSSDIPTLDPLQDHHNGGCGPLGSGCFDAFLLALNSNGTLVYSSYFGGTGGDIGGGVALDENGDVYLTGYSDSANQFPGNPNPSAGYDDIYLTRLRLSGSPINTQVIYSRFFGSADDEVAGLHNIDVDAQGSAYVTGFTWATYIGGGGAGAFPVTPNAAQGVSFGGKDGFLAKFSPTGSLVYSTLLGGEAHDYPAAVAVDAAGAAYVAGYTGGLN